MSQDTSLTNIHLSCSGNSSTYPVAVYSNGLSSIAVHYSDSTVVEYSVDSTDYADIQTVPPCPGGLIYVETDEQDEMMTSYIYTYTEDGVTTGQFRFYVPHLPLPPGGPAL